MAVQQRAFGHRLERQPQPALLGLARDELLEQERVLGQWTHILALEQGRQLVAETENAARLESHDRNSAPDQRCERGDAALGLAAGLIDEAHGEKRAPAAERATAAVRRDRKSTLLNSSHLGISYAV